MAGGAPIPVPLANPDEKILCVADLETLGSAKMTKTAREFYNSGSTDMQTLKSNSFAYDKYRLRPRVLVDVSQADTSTTLFDNKISFPLGVSPAGLQAMAHPVGELGTSRAAAKRGISMAISSFANYPISEITQAGTSIGPINYAIQLYTMKDRSLQKRIIQTAESNGVRAIFLTADSPVLGVRYNEWRNDFRTPPGLAFPILERTTEMIRQVTHDNGFVSFNDPSHNWARDVPWLRATTNMQIWIKGVLTAEDVEQAISWGCDGVLVSNHGGRQLDGVPATLDALPECVAAARGRIAIHVDGGIRRGQDIFKAIALGAQCCWVGRPAIWGLAYDGEAGVSRMLEVLHDEFMRCMQLTGCRTVRDITRDRLGLIDANGLLRRLQAEDQLVGRMDFLQKAKL